MEGWEGKKQDSEREGKGGGRIKVKMMEKRMEEGIKTSKVREKRERERERERKKKREERVCKE